MKSHKKRGQKDREAKRAGRLSKEDKAKRDVHHGSMKKETRPRHPDRTERTPHRKHPRSHPPVRATKPTKKPVSLLPVRHHRSEQKARLELEARQRVNTPPPPAAEMAEHEEDLPFQDPRAMAAIEEEAQAALKASVTSELPKPREPTEQTTAYTLYLREIGQTKLLTLEEEGKLAARIKRGDEKAREEMIKANLRLVVKIARDYEEYGLPLLDLINEGNIGLMKAVERFDPAKGAKLSTYAAWWIKQAIRRALANQSKTIRLPVHVGDKLLHMRRATMRLQEVLGREPTDEELAQELQTTPYRIAELRTAAIRPASLDAPIGGSDDESNPYADIVQDEKADTPYEQLEEKTSTDMVREMVATLPEREATILKHRFGLSGDKEKTLEEVGQQFGVTRERIRQIQNIALKKLRKMIEKRESVVMAA